MHGIQNIILSSFGLLVLVLLFTAYNCHTNIRNYLYLFRIGRRRKQGYLRLDSSEDFEYHAFVVFCDSDWSMSLHLDILSCLNHVSPRGHIILTEPWPPTWTYYPDWTMSLHVDISSWLNHVSPRGHIILTEPCLSTWTYHPDNHVSPRGHIILT
jgi:hypothetical protein